MGATIPSTTLDILPFGGEECKSLAMHVSSLVTKLASGRARALCTVKYSFVIAHPLRG
jgi:hypothetical protein